MSTENTILDQFLLEECTPHVCALIVNAATEHPASEEQRVFTFNRFNVTLNLKEGRALIADELDPTSDGELSLDMSELLAALRLRRNRSVLG